MKVKFTQVHTLFKPTVSTTEEGSKYASYSAGTSFMGNSFPVSDKGEFGEYGITQKHVRKLLTNSNLTFEKNDGIGVRTLAVPDYVVTEVEQYSEHTEITLEEL